MNGLIDLSIPEKVMQSCEMISKSGFCPTSFRNKPADVFCAIQYGLEIGFSPMQAIQSIAVINGKPSIYGDGLIGLCQSSPDFEDIQETFDETTMTATCVVKRKGRSPVVSAYSKREAEAAGLTKKEGPWRTYTKRMLQMRARGFALRDAFADKLKGIISIEEARDYEAKGFPASQKQFQKITPISPNIQVLERSSMTEETRHRLLSLVDAVKLSDERIKKLKEGAKVDSLEDLSEKQALNVIAKLEKELAESMKRDECEKVLMVRNGCEKCNDKPLGDYFCECEIKTADTEPGDESCEISVENRQVDKEEGEGNE